jgi:hypothetical protein
VLGCLPGLVAPLQRCAAAAGLDFEEADRAVGASWRAEPVLVFAVGAEGLTFEPAAVVAAVAAVAAVVAVVGGAGVEVGELAKPDLDGSLQNVGALDLVAAVRLSAVLDCPTGCDCWIETVHAA